MTDSCGDDNKVGRLAKRTKRMAISDDTDVNGWEQVLAAFPEHYGSECVSHFSKKATTTTGSGGGKSNPVCVHSDLFSDGGSVLCGFGNGTCKVVDVSTLTSEAVVVDRSQDFKHEGLSCIRCSRESPHLYFTSSSSDGLICTWDRREQKRSPSQKFGLDTNNVAGKAQKKPILQFDVSRSDQLLCGGTEMVDDDSYLLFWDVRSAKLLGAYWESHSDDVTAVRFHPTHNHCLASGSTDGLLNVFNLLEPAEDDALQFSFNTNSSVDSVHWPSSEKHLSQVMCVTHTNDVQVWDSTSGDPTREIQRKSIAEAMMRSNPEAVYVSSCHDLRDMSRVGLIACSLSGASTRLIELNDEMKPTSRGLFIDQVSVVQAAQHLKDHRWITFDEQGVIKVWRLQTSGTEAKDNRKNVSSGGKRSKRFKPYGRS